MTLEEWMQIKAAREALEKTMIDIARQIARLPEGNAARKALEELFKALLAAWEQLDNQMRVPDGPVIKAAPPPPPEGTYTPEELERIREANKELQHAIYELMREMEAR